MTDPALSPSVDDVRERWHGLLADQQMDEAWTKSWAERKEHRREVRAQLLDFLERYRGDAITLAEFQTTFDRKTRREWEGFGLKGLNGAMFLNKLVKHIGDTDRLNAELRAAIKAPAGIENSRQQLQRFIDYLNGMIETKQVTRSQVQPARTPFFLSAWWHQQDPEQWPVFYPSARQVLEQEAGYRPNPADLVAGYTSFLTTFNALRDALGLGLWDLEGLCLWLSERGPAPALPKPPVKPLPPVEPEPEPAPDDGAEVGSPHAHAQWLLATIGRRLNCRVWIASNDRTKTWNGQRLGDLSLDDLPQLGIGTAAQKLVRLIDVLWLKSGNQVVAAFEVEYSTSIYSGLLRMSDLATLAPNLNFPLYIVAPDSRIDNVRRELSRPTFQALDLHERCGYFSMETLVQDAEHILRFATSPAAIERLAQRVEDVSDEDAY